MVIPVHTVHRFQSIENGPIQHLRRQQQSNSQNRNVGQQPCITPAISNSTVNGSIMISTPQSAEVDSSIYIEASADGNVDARQHSQLMRLGGLIKYGMWASFGLITVSVVVTKFFISHQGAFEMLLLCTLGMLSIGLLGSCVLSVCRTKTAQDFITVPQQAHRAEADIEEVMAQREGTVLSGAIVVSVPSAPTVLGANRTVESEPEQPPPPYHIAILLPAKDRNQEDLPPPTYENAVR